MRLEVPFIPDDDYVRFLTQQTARIHSLYFSLYTEAAADSRHRFLSLKVEDLIARLSRIPGPSRYILLNSRFHLPQDRFHPDSLKSVTRRLHALLESGDLDGIVFADLYYLRALSDADPALARRLEAVPSINCMADSFDKVTATVEGIAATGFRLPGKYVLDRSLNRNFETLAEVSKRCRKAYPDMHLGLLANEGCLYQCPFKPAHDAQISLVHMDIHVDTYGVNRDLGCMRTLRERPHLLFKSPFIRPEDAHAYADAVDFIKLSGRTLGPDFLRRVVTAYIRGQYTGNLLELLDSMEWFAGEWNIPNHELPADFHNRMVSCDRSCGECEDCRNLFETYAEKREARLPDFR